MQSQRLDRYHAASEALLRDGHAYRCFCTADDLARDARAPARGQRPQGYEGACRDLDAAQAAERAAGGART